MKTLFALGFGYVAARLAPRLIREGWRVIGTTRSEDKAQEMEAAGVEPVLSHAASSFTVPEGAHWLVSTPPRDGVCTGFDLFGAQAASAGWIGYISTTAVYGDRRGGWVLENTGASPDSPRGRARLEAEQTWRASNPQTWVFRLPGIYGPGRSVFDGLRDRSARIIEKKGQVFSRVHVDDIGSGLIGGMERRPALRTLNLVDDLPSPPADPIVFAAGLLDVSPPEPLDFETADLSPMARSFYSECKRVGNGMTKAALGWQPRYPTYREGLTAILAEESDT